MKKLPKIEAPTVSEDNTLNIANSKKHNVRISNEEWFKISSSLSSFHGIFYKIWQMGKPIFNDEIATAAVSFDKLGNFIYFHFNPHFWKKIEFKHKLFVICHEALHIILHHGQRTINGGKKNHNAINAALDVVVNHLLVNSFGFDLSEIFGWQDYCWVSTVFPHMKPLPPEDEMFEYYYNLFDKTYGDGGMGDGETSPIMVDDHSIMNEDSDIWDDAIDYLNENISFEDKNSLKSLIEKHFQKSKETNEQKDKQAGSGSGSWSFSVEQKVIKKKKWETIIKKWRNKYIVCEDKNIDQWARINRRWTSLSNNMFLPSEMEIESSIDKKARIDVWFYLDTSGSCFNLKDRFFAAALSLPEETFNIRLFCFDTSVQETTLESRQIYGDGGTEFGILEKEIITELSQGGGTKKLLDGKLVKKIKKYPDAIFVITDGFGNSIKLQHPDRWHWFLTEGGTKQYIDPHCNFYSLDKFS